MNRSRFDPAKNGARTDAHSQGRFIDRQHLAVLLAGSAPGDSFFVAADDQQPLGFNGDLGSSSRHAN